MKVALRKKKLKDGRISLYLDIYKGAGVRDYEFLGIYIYDNPKTPAEREHNKEKLMIAETIRARRELELLSGRYQAERITKNSPDFATYTRQHVQYRSETYKRNAETIVKHLYDYAGGEVTLKDITPELCKGFLDYLRSRGLKPNAVRSYWSFFAAIVNTAVRDGYLLESPLKGVEQPRPEPTKREFLTIGELRELAQTPCRREDIKRMFLFSCLTGLRFCDIANMRWGDVQETEQGVRLIIQQQKTKEVEYIYLSHQAVELLGERGNPDEFVFPQRNYYPGINLIIENWLLRAGIHKKITFHCARHTFAVLQLALGTDIYTVSKLLGHKNLDTTQIYAKIIDEKKREAVERIPEIL